LPFASWTWKGRRPEADALDSGAFYVFNLTASNALSWVKPANACLRSLACMCSLACGGRVSLHVFLLECCYLIYLIYTANAPNKLTKLTGSADPPLGTQCAAWHSVQLQACIIMHRGSPRATQQSICTSKTACKQHQGGGCTSASSSHAAQAASIRGSHPVEHPQHVLDKRYWASI
jgi:hypothetical protein